MLRQIGWDLHRDYPVLLVKRYDTRIKGLIRDLYDDRKKGVLLLADETIGERERLEADIHTLDRACALIVSARKTSDIGSGEKRGIIHFNSILSTGERTLCKRFKEYSPLSDIRLQEKDLCYDAFVKPIGMRCPFMIGLYYQEEHFSGVTDYVERTMEQVKETWEVKILAMLAFCSCYGGIGLPQAFVNRYLQIPLGMSLFKYYPYAKTVLIPIQDGLCGSIDTYNSKHYLISWELLNQCSQRLYGSAAKNCLTDLSKLLIDAIYDAYQAKAADVYQDILEFIFIEKEVENDKFSQLILDTASPSSRKEILQYLAEKFNTLVEQYAPEDADYLYRMTAHFYGHLGRLCHNRDIGTDNPLDAKTYCEKAVELMEASSIAHPDPRIYHMLGESRSALLRKQLDAADLHFQNSPDECPSSEAYAAYEKEIDDIRVIFEKTADYGSEDYAISSLIKLYLLYLDKVYRWKKIQSTAQLSERQVGYRTEIERLLEWSYSKELSENSRSEFQSLEDNYRSKFSQDGSNVIQYYENRLSSLKGCAGVDDEILNARRGLITARLSRHYAVAKEKPGEYITLKSTELLSTLEQLEEVLGGQCDACSYRQRSIRISCYDRWFYLAKMPGSGRPLEKAIGYSERWIDLSEQSGGKDPRPYYYYAVCSTMYMLAGNSVDQSKIAYCWKKCESLGRNFTDKLRDVIVRSSGMEQLLDMRYAGRNPGEYMEVAGKTPLILGGIFDRIEADRGYICLHTPTEWNGKAVKFTRGKGNSVGENQQTHKLQTFAGFSYEGFRAVDQYVRDITANEAPPQLSQRDPSKQKKSISKNTEQNKTKRNPSPKSPIDPSTTKAADNASDSIGSHKVFHPKYIKNKWDNPNEPQYLNGDVDDGFAGISVQYLTNIFGVEKIDAFGGIHDILDTLIEKVHEIDTIVKDIRVSDEKKQYTLYLHDESIELLQLLQPQEMSEHSLETSEQAVQVELLELPDFSGKKVTLIPSDLTLSKLTGAFQIDGEEYVGTLINVKTGNDKKKALKYKGKIPAIIQGKPQSGKYCLKML
ncbi:MAG: hypothetical protein VB096_02230 [Pseudoflavonifractor sp.]|nr:hypothetical protein [Pseudoflavonifractor sp.]